MTPTLSTSRGDVYITADIEELSHKAGEFVVELAARSVQQSGRFTLSLSGGSTPKSLYSTLASPQFRDRIPWSSVHLFWGDERCVPPDHAQSNYRMVNEALISKVSIPAANIHRLEGENSDPKKAAEKYEALLKELFHLQGARRPRFDLLFLGMGDEGHTASLFPDSAALTELQRLVVANYVDKLHAWRLTFTMPVINAAAEVAFLIAGAGKAEIVSQVFAGAPLPAAQVQPSNGQLSWFFDRAAAGKLSAAS